MPIFPIFPIFYLLNGDYTDYTLKHGGSAEALALRPARATGLNASECHSLIPY